MSDRIRKEGRKEGRKEAHTYPGASIAEVMGDVRSDTIATPTHHHAPAEVHSSELGV